MRSPGLDNANTRSPQPSEVIAHYLEAIYYIRAEGEAVRSARLADWLSVSRPTVTVALRRMTRDGMVRLNAHKEIELTARGDQAAAAIVRRHRIMERWLTDVLGLDWVTADAEAGFRSSSLKTTGLMVAAECGSTSQPARTIAHEMIAITVVASIVCFPPC